MTLNEAVERQKEPLLQTLCESIRIRSVQQPAQEGAPYGPGVQQCLEHALAAARALGFATVDLDHQMGWCEYGTGDEMIAVLGHLDVVPEGDGWSFDPFGGIVQEGKVFGRGSMDDKGPTMAALYALAALRDSGLPLRRRIRLLFGTNEETGSADMKYYKAHGGEMPVMGFTPDGEYPVINGEKGIINVTFSHTYTQTGPVQLASITGGTAHNIVPAAARAEIVCPAEQKAELMQLAAGERISCTETHRGFTLQAAGVSAHGATPEIGINAAFILLQKPSGWIPPAQSWALRCTMKPAVRSALTWAPSRAMPKVLPCASTIVIPSPLPMMTAHRPAPAPLPKQALPWAMNPTRPACICPRTVRW